MSIKDNALLLLSDKAFVSLKYWYHFRKLPDLKNPTTYNEKIQWLKLYDRNPLYPLLVDKYEVKEYVKGIIGESYIVPNYGIWSSFDSIDFEKLPNQFVLKCTHDSGGLVICRDKSSFDYNVAKQKINTSLHRNYYNVGREWPYKNVSPRILAEQLLQDNETDTIRDYKFFCFNGKVEFLYLSEGLENHKTAQLSFVSLDWKPLWFTRSDYKPFEELPQKPNNLEKMIEVAEILSKGFPHIRVDLYDVYGHIYFGELTLHTGSGFIKFTPQNADLEIGKLLVLPTV